MPHQCLKCGAVFQEGSRAILKGCPECGGTRFFFTDKPLSDSERKKLTEAASKDIKFLIRDILTREPKTKLEKIGLEKEWLRFEPKKPREPGVMFAREKKILGVRKVKKPVKAKRKEEKKAAEKTIAKSAPTEEVPKKPEVVNIIESGVYEIDVESLLEESPVVVRRDGTYLIHLPSLFEKLLAKK